MARPLRFQHPEAIYHVTSNGVHDTPIYLDDEDRNLWLIGLGKIVDDFQLKVYAWCEMTTHNHILLKAPYCNLDDAMHWLNGVYAQGFNRRHRRKGHLFGDRYSVWLIQDELHFRRSARYIYRNPVEAFMCEFPGEWKWSSYTPTLIESRPWPANAAWEVLQSFHRDPAIARELMKAFVEEGLPLARAAA